MAKRQTNTQFVRDLMEYSNHGALCQVFILTAIEKYAQACSEERIPDDGLISADAWQDLAKEVKGKLEAHFNQ